MNQTKRTYLPKLFGGPMHGRRIVLPDATKLSYIFPIRPRIGIQSYFEGSLFDPPGTSLYLRREAKIGTRLVTYYATAKASDERAFVMLCNHMLRGAIEL